MEYWQLHFIAYHSGPSSSYWCSITKLLLTHRASRRRMCIPPLWWSSAWSCRHITVGVLSCHSSKCSLDLYVLVVTKRSLHPMWFFFMVSHFEFSRTFSRPLPLSSKPFSSPRTTTCFFNDLCIHTRNHAHLPLIFLCISPLFSHSAYIPHKPEVH